MRTVIFDMDGLLIDSEPMWKEAERTVFSSVGVEFSKRLTDKTASMTTREVTAFWFTQSPWQGRSLEQVENEVVDYVESSIKTQGKALPGVHHALELFHQHQFKIGLATNSPSRLIPVVLDKLNITDFFHTITSSEEVSQGKPHPAVYLSTLSKLGATPASTMAIEDSVAGMRAAMAADIRTLVVPASEKFDEHEFDLASLKLRNLNDFSHETLTQFWRGADK